MVYFRSGNNESGERRHAWRRMIGLQSLMIASDLDGLTTGISSSQRPFISLA